MIVKIMDAGSGVRLHRLTRETFVLNLNGQKIDFTGIIFDCPDVRYYKSLILRNIDFGSHNRFSMQ